MAYVGLGRPVVAKMTEVNGRATYSDGFRFGKAIGVDISPEYNEGSLYGDNRQIESVKEFKKASISLNTNTIPVKAYEIVFGHDVNTEGDVTEVEYKTDDESPYIGFGFCTDEIVDSKKKYVAIWIPKATFSEGSSSYKTKGENLEFQTPSIDGVAIGLDGKQWKYIAICSTESEAFAWLDEKANIEEGNNDGE